MARPLRVRYRNRSAIRSLTLAWLIAPVFAATLAVLRLLPSDFAAEPPQALADWQVVSPDPELASFTLCHSGGGSNCVVDGDTFWLRDEKIRIADIDAPETHPSRCAVEASKGAAATRRLQALLSAGPFALESIDRDTDRYGRKLRVVTRGGESLGGVLVSEGLARWYEGGRQLWC